MYSQGKEDEFVSNYFKEYKGTLLDIGANDGKTLSNSLLLIEQGWKAHLLEPNNQAYSALISLHNGNANVLAYPIGLSDSDGFMDYYESGSHLTDKDHSLLSTLHYGETLRWGDTANFELRKAIFLSWSSWLQQNLLTEGTFDYITIDAEGEDWNILRQIDLTLHNCKVLCVEWNSHKNLRELYSQYASSHNMKEAHINANNIIFTK
jgi:FkbM family methyltransferase